MVEVCRALAPSPLFGKGRYINIKLVFLLVSCHPASNLPLLEVGARAGPGLSQVALPMPIITDFPWATQVSPLGWNIQEGMLHTPLFFISVAVLGHTGADLKPDMTWLVKFVSFIFSGSSCCCCCCCCTFHRLCCTCSAIKGGTSIHGSGRSFPLLLLGFGWTHEYLVEPKQKWSFRSSIQGPGNTSCLLKIIWEKSRQHTQALQLRCSYLQAGSKIERLEQAAVFSCSFSIPLLLYTSPAESRPVWFWIAPCSPARRTGAWFAAWSLPFYLFPNPSACSLNVSEAAVSEERLIYSAPLPKLGKRAWREAGLLPAVRMRQWKA